MVKMFYDKEKKEWIQVQKGEEGIYYDSFLLRRLYNIKYLQKKGWDVVFIITGREGSGKSTLSFEIGQFISDMSLTLDNIASGTTDAINKLNNLPDGSVLIVDEAELLFSSRETMSSEQRQLTKILMIIRQKKMCLILVSPVFFDLSKYVAVERARFLIRVYTDKNLNRGRYQYWGEKKKRTLYELGKKNYGNYSKPKPDFYGRFYEYKLPFDDEYQKTKMKSLMEAFEPKKKTMSMADYRKVRDKIIQEALARAEKLNYSEFASIFDVGKSTLERVKAKKIEDLPS